MGTLFIIISSIMEVMIVITDFILTIIVMINDDDNYD